MQLSTASPADFDQTFVAYFILQISPTTPTEHPFKFETCSSLTAHSFIPIQYNPAQVASSNPLFTRSKKTTESGTTSKEAVTGSTFHNGDDSAVCHTHKAPPSPGLDAKNADTGSGAGSTHLERPPQSHPSRAEYHGAIERLQVLLEDEESSHEQIYEAYSQLPSPDHMKEASIPLTESEWNSAIAYAGRCFVRVEATEVESALHIWKEMEREAGVKSGGVTFNILFDIATKAGKHVLAEMVLNEMKTRGLAYNRFSYVGLIYYYGFKGDGAAIRTAYRDLVEAGQIVDTVVMNCVIASLIRAGEFPAAQQVYERMKGLVHRRTGQPIPRSDWRASRDMGRALDKASRTMRNDHQALQRLQAEQCLAPNLRTFCILLDHHVYVTGELRQVTALLEEMQMFDVPLHGRIYVRIFKGFAYHGGMKYTSWTRQRLESVWTSLLSILNEDIGGVQMVKWMVIWVVRAFARCCGRERALQIWEEVRDRWKLAGEDEQGAVEHLLRHVLENTASDDRHQ
ncbi:MAG: hypothetical protein L6R35_003843 [Caloplaca aegaea]|nr:MAG: hypothetical protein L6R35_003843 [Caloplaca aegaea]